MTPTLQDRIRGVAVGAAVGDALGMPLEFMPAVQDPDNWVRQMMPGRLSAGAFTDDTEMALALAESLLRFQPLDCDDVATRFLDWMYARPPDIGMHTAKVLRWISSGLTWQLAARKTMQEMPDSAGNGSVMRCWPIAIVDRHDPARLVADSRQQSRITHPHPDCLSACAFVNLAIMHLFNEMPIRPALEAAREAAGLEISFYNLVEAAPDRRRMDLKNTGWVRHTVESAVWALCNTDSFEDALVRAVNLGADADTTGAVTGALAGAAYGLEAIPAAWQDALHGYYPLGTDRLLIARDFIRLADELAK